MPFTDATKNDVLLKMNQERQALAQKPELFAQKGALLNFFARGTHDQLFEQEAFKLAIDGAISLFLKQQMVFVFYSE